MTGSSAWSLKSHSRGRYEGSFSVRVLQGASAGTHMRCCHCAQIDVGGAVVTKSVVLKQSDMVNRKRPTAELLDQSAKDSRRRLAAVQTAMRFRSGAGGNSFMFPKDNAQNCLA